jgi:hypothetical protein
MELIFFRFEIARGCGNNLQVPVLLAGQKMDGAMLCHLFPQRTVWLLPSHDIDEEVSVL